MTRPRTSQTTAECGFSLIESLIAMTMMAIIIAGILPIFTRAMQANQAGRESTDTTNLAKTELETLLQLPFNNFQLPVGVHSSPTVAYFLRGAEDTLGDEEWSGSLSPTDFAYWNRTTRISTYSLNGIADGDLDGVIDTFTGLEDLNFDGVFDNPLPAGAPARSVHLKELDVLLENRRQGGKGFSRVDELNLKVLKAF